MLVWQTSTFLNGLSTDLPYRFKFLNRPIPLLWVGFLSRHLEIRPKGFTPSA
jgi:hypothetical protein